MLSSCVNRVQPRSDRVRLDIGCRSRIESSVCPIYASHPTHLRQTACRKTTLAREKQGGRLGRNLHSLLAMGHFCPSLSSLVSPWRPTNPQGVCGHSVVPRSLSLGGANHLAGHSRCTRVGPVNAYGLSLLVGAVGAFPRRWHATRRFSLANVVFRQAVWRKCVGCDA